MSVTEQRAAVTAPASSILPRRASYLPFGQPCFGEDEIAAVARVIRSGWIGLGPETQAFERELALAVRAPHVVTVSSCTAAMTLSLRVLGIGPGDEVICPSLTWCSTANAALYVGASPVFCDVDPLTFCLTPETVRAALTSRTRAVMAVHFGGRAVDVATLRMALPDRVAIVEDAAHAFGATYPNGQPVGSSGNIVCFSFYANKNLSTGEGGAAAIFDGELADRFRSIRQHALPVDAWQRFTQCQTILYSPQLTELGYKANYTDLQAALGRVQLQRQGELSHRRRDIAHRYLQHIEPLANRIQPQTGVELASHARHLFAVRITSSTRHARDDLLLELRQRNIGATVHYALLHSMPLYKAASRGSSLPTSEILEREILTLPISASMSVNDADYVCHHLAELLC